MRLRRGAICFRTTTVRYASTLRPAGRRAFLRTLALDNAHALAAAVDWCLAHRPLGVGAFRLNSGFWPLFTHARLGYALDELDPDGAQRELLAAIGALGRDAAGSA